MSDLKYKVGDMLDSQGKWLVNNGTFEIISVDPDDVGLEYKIKCLSGDLHDGWEDRSSVEDKCILLNAEVARDVDVEWDDD